MLNLKVEGIHCSGCARAIQKALAGTAPGLVVDVDITGGKVRVDGSLDRAKVVAAIESAGYNVTADVG